MSHFGRFNPGTEAEPDVRYEFCLSLSIQHPSADPVRFTRGLGLEPRVTDQAGLPRVRNGHEFAIQKSSYWLHDFDSHRYDSGLEDALGDVVARLEAHSKLFKEIVDDGGSTLISVGLFLASRNSGFTLPPSLQMSCAQLNIGLDFDIYEQDKPVTELE